MKTHANFVKALLPLIALALLVELGGCKSQEIDVPFETLEKREGPLGPDGRYFEGKAPTVFIIANADEIAQLGHTVSPDARAQLRNLDFKQYIAVAVFRGLNQYLFEIERIGHAGNSINIYAHFASPDPKLARLAVQISPYQLITIPRGGLHGSIEFKLNADGRVISQTVSTFP